MVLLQNFRRTLSHAARYFISTSSPISTAYKVERIGCTASNIHFLDKYDTFLFDCDGVLWQNDHVTPLPGTANAIKKLQDMNKRILYVTNNSITSRATLQKKFQEHGFHASLETIFGTGYGAALYLKDVLKIKGKVYLVGSEGMKWELDQLGLESIGYGPDLEQPTSNIDSLLKWHMDNNVEAVLVGFDEYFSYNKMFKAATYLLNKNCHFLVTNNVEKGIFIGSDAQRRRMPMAGTLANAIGEAAGREAVVIGKPFGTLYDCLTKSHSTIDRKRTVFVGDNLKSDMGFAKTVGIDSALVLTGVNMLEHVNDMPHLAPNYVINSLADILH